MRPRLLLVQVEGSKETVLSRAQNLRKSEVWNNTYIDPDRTPQQRLQHKELRMELKKRREAGEQSLVIRHDKIVPRHRRTDKHQPTLYDYVAAATCTAKSLERDTERVNLSKSTHGDAQVHVNQPSLVPQKDVKAMGGGEQSTLSENQTSAENGSHLTNHENHTVVKPAHSSLQFVVEEQASKPGSNSSRSTLVVCPKEMTGHSNTHKDRNISLASKTPSSSPFLHTVEEADLCTIAANPKRGADNISKNSEGYTYLPRTTSGDPSPVKEAPTSI